MLAEVARHRARREHCQARGERIVESLKGQPEAKLEIALKSHTLECRVVMLDAKDQLMLKLSPEGVTTLNTWMLNERRKTRSIMPKSELEFYRLPR